MPTVLKLSINSFRNLHSVTLTPSEGINLVFGKNGSGKTSLLEAISVLAHGRSFRTHKYRALVKDSCERFTLFCEVSDINEPNVDRIGVERNISGEIAIKINGKAEYSSASLAQKLPVLILTSMSFQILEGGAKQRRQFLDWLVFHVKHDFKDAWKDYTKCVKQRNSLLRRGKIAAAEMSPWDARIATSAKQIEVLRKEVFKTFSEEFQRVVTLFEFNRENLADESENKLNIHYQSGWKGENYKELLSESLERDIRLGYTSVGSHKSDLKIVFGKQVALERLSRGQQKSVILSMFIAAARCYKSITGKKPVVLLDDLPAELDEENLKIVNAELKRLGFQLFITAIESDSIVETWESRIKSMFHVEHGCVNHMKLTDNQETDSNYE